MRAFTALVALALVGAAAAQSGHAVLYPGFDYDWAINGNVSGPWRAHIVKGAVARRQQMSFRLVTRFSPIACPLQCNGAPRPPAPPPPLQHAGRHLCMISLFIVCMWCMDGPLGASACVHGHCIALTLQRCVVGSCRCPHLVPSPPSLPRQTLKGQLMLNETYVALACHGHRGEWGRGCWTAGGWDGIDVYLFSSSSHLSRIRLPFTLLTFCKALLIPRPLTTGAGLASG
jgi:hypothetical protein